jgi:digeranylgeranylglycerophospholipid reductase
LPEFVVIGGGPIGSRVAYQLASVGHSVVVLEKRSSVGQKPCCTGIISSECARLFAIDPSVILREAASAVIYSPSGQTLRVSKNQPQACIVDRPAFDRFMADKARAKGVNYYINSEAESISFKNTKVEIIYNHHKTLQKIECEAVILATGFNAALASRLGLDQTEYCVAGAQIEVKAKGLSEVEVYFDQDLAPGFFGWLVPTSEDKCLAGLLSRKAPGSHLRKWLSKLEASDRIDSVHGRVHFGGIPLKPLRNTSADRLIVVGDAAGQVKPTTSGGIYFGLLCADIAADVLAKAIQKDDLSGNALASYQTRWQKKLNHELRMEYFARRMYEKLNNKQIDSLLNKIKSSGAFNSPAVMESVSFDWHGDLLLKALKMGISSEFSRLMGFPSPFSRR